MNRNAFILLAVKNNVQGYTCRKVINLLHGDINGNFIYPVYDDHDVSKLISTRF